MSSGGQDPDQPSLLVVYHRARHCSPISSLLFLQESAIQFKLGDWVILLVPRAPRHFIHHHFSLDPRTSINRITPFHTSVTTSVLHLPHTLSIMGFHRSSMEIHLKDGHVLCAYCRRPTGEATYSELDLDHFIGTKKGKQADCDPTFLSSTMQA